MTLLNSIEHLEAQFAALHAAPGAVATGFGRGALYLALESISVRGADVLVPDFICAQVLNAIQAAGAQPVFYPVPLELTVTPEALAAAITPQTRAAILVHYFGAPQPHIAELAAACRARGIATIEDCSLALLAQHPAGLCGTFADYATFSFTKNNWCSGGGMSLARDAHAVNSMREIRAQKFTSDDSLCETYGRLSQLDFESNRPSLARQSAEQGARLQAELTRTDPRFRTSNFFDVPSCHVAMSPLAAQRALAILRAEPALAKQRQAHQMDLVRALSERSPWRPLLQEGANGSFIVLVRREGHAGELAHSACALGITLRPVWPSFQPQVPQTVQAEFLAILEVHPMLSPAEIELIRTSL